METYLYFTGTEWAKWAETYFYFAGILCGLRVRFMFFENLNYLDLRVEAYGYNKIYTIQYTIQYEYQWKFTINIYNTFQYKFQSNYSINFNSALYIYTSIHSIKL